VATPKRQSTKTISMPSATMTSAPEESVPERVTQRKAEGGDLVSRWIDKRKARMRPMKLRKKWDW